MKFKRSFISILLCLALILTSFAALSAVQATAANTKKVSTGNSNTGELVLKCWNWPLSVIDGKLDEIAEAGFTVIETSAVNGIVGSGNEVSNWYQFYQPTNYNIGNKIGTENEFKTLCAHAKAKGIKIIVDVVLNHTTDQQSMVDSSLRHWHSSSNSISNWDSRYDVTQYRLNGLPDLDTSRSDIQSLANTFLKKLISDGASGFRFDAAKHIELPSAYDGSYNCASDYWPNALNGVNDTFSYGEVLGGTNANEYMNYMKITDSGYSGNIKYNISHYQLPASAFTNYDHGADPDYLVNYVETHDNYVSDGNYGMSNFQVQLAWAAIAAMGNNCMYLARPYGIETDYYTGTGKPSSDSRSNYDYFQQVLASGKYATQGGDGAYLRSECAEVNKFHNAMSGEASYCSNINNNNQILAVRRGTKGVCIINAGSSDQTFSGLYTGMANGTYKDTINNTTFTVSNGKLTGTVQGGKIYPIYSDSGSGTQTNDYYLTGDSSIFGTTAWATNLDANKMTNNNGVYTKTYTNVPAGTIEYKVTGPGGWGDNEIPSSGNNSVAVSTAGSTVTFTLSNGNLSATVTPPTTPVDPEEPTTDGNFYLSVGAPYTDANPKWYIWTWGSNNGRAVQGTYDTASQCYKFTDFDSNIIVLRVNPDYTFNGSNWGNPPVWTQGSDIAVPSGSNKLTINDWNLTGTWSSYVPTYDYTVIYTYSDKDGANQTITKTVNNSTLTDANLIAALNDPSESINNAEFKYSIDSATKSGTTVNVSMTKAYQEYTVRFNNTVKGSNYHYLSTVTLESPTGTETGWLINGDYVKTSKSLTVYVTGNTNITTDSTSTRKEAVSIDLMGSYFTSSQVSYELLATANVNSFKRMGVAFASSSKGETALKTAINAVQSGTALNSNTKIAVHNSSIDQPNGSGLYQFRYGPYMSKDKIPTNGGTLYFYTFAETKNGDILLSTAKTVSVKNTIA